MCGTHWSCFVLFALIVMMTSFGLLGFLRQMQVNRTSHLDDDSWFLIIFIVVAILSIGCFIAFIFLRGVVV